MPIYEYKCKKCGSDFEMIQGFSEEPLNKCGECGGKLHKLVSECSFHLKGSGWYVTDYGKSNSTSPPKSTKDTDKKEKIESKKAESSTTSESSGSEPTAKKTD